MKKVWIVLGAIAGVLLLMGATLISGRNKLVMAEETITESWAQVENVLQRRNDLIPNLVNTVKGFAAQEKEIFTRVADARAKLGGAQTIPEKISANQELGGALSRLLMIVENYPVLKSDRNFLALQDELAGTENRIAVERRRYNQAVRTYNILVRRFPSSVAAGLFGFTTKDIYFEAAEAARAVPQVAF